MGRRSAPPPPGSTRGLIAQTRFIINVLISMQKKHSRKSKAQALHKNELGP